MNKTSVAEAVRGAIARHPLDNLTLSVWEDQIAQAGGWWRVPLISSPWPERRFALYEVLAEIEGDLQDDHGLDILLSLGEPVNTDYAPVASAA